MADKKKVVIDCDPGIDDFFALLLCIRHLDVQGIVAVGGNTGLEFTERNARFITEFTDRTDIPVYAGYDMPILNQLVRASEIHGSGGMGDAVIPEPKKALEKQHGVDYLIDVFMNNDDISLITLGPLTNVAQAILKEPKLKERIPEILCMGGAAFCGNTTPAAEFNILVDPEAAKIVFDAGIPIQMVGLNLTRQNHITEADLEMFKEFKGEKGEFVNGLMEFAVKNYGYTNLCDASAVSWWIDSAIITKSIKVDVNVETKGEYTRGMTVCDWRSYMGSDPAVEITREPFCKPKLVAGHVDVAMEFDAERFDKLLLETLRTYC